VGDGPLTCRGRRLEFFAGAVEDSQGEVLGRRRVGARRRSGQGLTDRQYPAENCRKGVRKHEVVLERAARVRTVKLAHISVDRPGHVDLCGLQQLAVFIELNELVLPVSRLRERVAGADAGYANGEANLSDEFAATVNPRGVAVPDPCIALR